MSSTKQKTKKSGANGVSTPLLIAAVAAVGGFFYWRWKQTQDTSKSSRSPFKFPASKSSSSSQQQQQESSLPRNKAGNNKKKNKARKKQEKERRAQKKEAAATGKKAGSSSSSSNNNNKQQQGDSGVPQSAAVLNYSYWDSGRNDSSVKIKPKDNKVKPEDVMPQQ